MPNSTLVRPGLWRFLRGPGLERFELLRQDEDWVLRGTILVLAEGRPTEARYEVSCDDNWLTRRVEVTLQDEEGTRSLLLSAENARWYRDGREIDAVRGCLDIDLGWSPSTNTLPIRRLSLAVGASSGPLTAAWVRFPQLEVESLPQEYHRLAERRYRYTSRGGSFTAELDVDEHGLVLNYGGVWERVEGQ